MKNFVSVILAASENNDFSELGLSETKLKFCVNQDLTLLHEIYREYKSPRKTIIACRDKDVEFFRSDGYFKAATFVEIKGETAGALATLALTVDHIEQDIPILVTPGDGLIIDKIQPFLGEMVSDKVAAGVIVFPSVNPNYSYVRSVGNLAIETAEKVVIGKLATVGVYYFQNKKILLECIKWVLVNNLHVGGLYYLSVGMNQLIAQGNRVKLFEIGEAEYFRFATIEEALLSRERLKK